MVIRATSEAEVVGAVRAGAPLRIFGCNTHSLFRPSLSDVITELQIALSGIVECMPDDQVVVVRAGTSLLELQEELRRVGQCLPVADPRDGGALSNRGTIGGNVAMALPHLNEAKTGTWRDWVLGATIITAEGIVVKAGSRAVKNVAGYDMHKFLVGSRGTLGIFTELILRTYPIKSVPITDAIFHGAIGEEFFIQRTLPADFREACFEAGTDGGVDLRSTSTLWRNLSNEGITRFVNDWVIVAGQKRPQIDEPELIPWMTRAKSLFDPKDRLNPGEFGLV